MTQASECTHDADCTAHPDTDCPDTRPDRSLTPIRRPATSNERYELNVGMQAAARSPEWNADDFNAMIDALETWTEHDFRKFAHYMTGFRPSMLVAYDRYRLAHKERYGE
jgi:hypothetical protein